MRRGSYRMPETLSTGTNPNSKNLLARSASHRRTSGDCSEASSRCQSPTDQNFRVQCCGQTIASMTIRRIGARADREISSSAASRLILELKAIRSVT